MRQASDGANSHLLEVGEGCCSLSCLLPPGKANHPRNVVLRVYLLPPRDGASPLALDTVLARVRREEDKRVWPGGGLREVVVGNGQEKRSYVRGEEKQGKITRRKAGERGGQGKMTRGRAVGRG